MGRAAAERVCFKGFEMILIKLFYHLMSGIKKAFYKVLYQNKVSFGSRMTFRSRFAMAVEGQGRVEIGADCFFNNDCSIACMGHVQIGDGTIFGSNVRIYDHNHHFSDPDRSIKEQGYAVGEVRVGRHCWIASNVTLLKGCEIGDNCMVGVGCVISERIPANTVVKLEQQQTLFERRN